MYKGNRSPQVNDLERANRQLAFKAAKEGIVLLRNENHCLPLSEKRIALFGSYSWADGQWMRDWCARSDDAGAILLDEKGLICYEAPDADGQEACRDLGRRLAAW